MITSIYTLSDPISDEIRYVGKTNVKIERRYSQHIYQWKRSISKITHVNSWIKSLASKGLKPVLHLIDEVEYDWEFWERFWIEQCRSWGYNLCNHTLGGEGTVGYKPSIESLIKRSISILASEAWKEKHKRHSEIMKQKHSEGIIKFGYAHLPEEKRKIIGNKHSDRMKLIHANDSKQINKLINSRNIPVIQTTKSGKVIRKFKSASEAARYYNIENTHITRVCKGKSKSGQTHGLYFEYDKPKPKNK